METEVTGFAARNTARNKRPNPHRVTHLQPEAEKLLNGWSKINAWLEQQKHRVATEKTLLRGSLVRGTPTCLKNLLVVVLIGCY